jgi:hypothetical protein
MPSVTGIEGGFAFMTPTAAKQSVPTPPADEALVPELDPELIPNLDELVTEEGAPLDNIYTEKQRRLLTEPLYSSWVGPGEGRSFLVLANVGWFYSYRKPPLVTDALLSLDAVLGGPLHAGEGRYYFQWLIGKAPDVIIEIVADRHGGEEDIKMQACALQRVFYYAIYDPANLLEGGMLRAYELQRIRYEPIEPGWLHEVGLGLAIWEGTFEGQHAIWLRWCDEKGA